MPRPRVRNRWQWLTFAILLLSVTQAARAAQPEQLVFLFRGGTLQALTVESWIREFEAKNPGVTVEWQEAAGDWQTKLPIQVAAGVGPDVFEMWGGVARNWGETGVTLDLRPYIARDFRAADIDDFYPVSWGAAELTFGPKKGVRYGMPSNGNVFLTYYHKDKFQEAGVPFLPVLDSQGSWTWDGLIAVGKKLTRSDGNKITQWALDSDCMYYPTGRGSGWVHAAGGQYFDLPNNPTRFVGDSPAVVTAFAYLQDLIWKYQIMTPIDSRGQASFRAGNSAMNLWLGTANLKHSEDNLKFEWDLGPRPMGPKARGYYLASDMFGVSSESKYKEAAWQFVKYLTSTEGQNVYARVQGRGPTRRSSFPYYQSLYPKRSLIYNTEGMMDAVLSPATYMTSEADSLINKTVREQIATNKKHPQQALSEIAEALSAMQK